MTMKSNPRGELIHYWASEAKKEYDSIPERDRGMDEITFERIYIAEKAREWQRLQAKQELRRMIGDGK